MSGASDMLSFYTPTYTSDIINKSIRAFEESGFETSVDREELDESDTQESHKFRIGRNSKRFNAYIYPREDRPRNKPVVGVSCAQLIKPHKAADEQEFRDRMHAVFELLCRLSVSLDADYAPLFCPPNRQAELDGRPAAEHIDDLPRIGVYDQSVIDQFGGLEAMYDAEPWYTATLEGDKTVVVESEDPWDSVDWQPPTDAEFLAEASFASPDERTTPGFEDPFGALETGAIGTDLCVPREKIGPEFRNEDLELVRVQVDDQRDLRRLDTGAFVRNVVDDDPGDDAAFMMAMLEEIPPDATADDLMVSALLHEAVPPAFVRLDDPDGKNVVTAVADLEIDVNKVELLISLGSIARTEGFTDEKYRELIDFLETLDPLESVENIETAVRKRLC